MEQGTRKSRTNITREVTLLVCYGNALNTPFGGIKRKHEEAWKIIFNKLIQRSSLDLYLIVIKAKVRRLITEFKSNKLKYK